MAREGERRQLRRHRVFLDITPHELPDAHHKSGFLGNVRRRVPRAQFQERDGGLPSEVDRRDLELDRRDLGAAFLVHEGVLIVVAFDGAVFVASNATYATVLAPSRYRNYMDFDLCTALPDLQGSGR